MEQIEIRDMRPGEHVVCERILRALPDWFGDEPSIVQYVRDIEAMETWIAEVTGDPAGFLTLHRHNEFSGEIHVLAVMQRLHGQGVGRQLVEHAERVLRSRSVEFLEVKTLGPSKADSNYERTRGFYRRLGFRPLEENGMWGETNPCLIMVKHLDCMADPGSQTDDRAQDGRTP